MSAGTRETATAHDGQVVHFYEHDIELVDAVGPYLAAAIGADETAIVLATEAHRRAFEAELEASGIDLVLEHEPASGVERNERIDQYYERTDLYAQEGVSATFPAEPGSLARARRMAAATLRRWGRDEPLVEDVCLVVSELASNAVRHAGSPFALALQMQDQLLRVTVEDRAPLPDPAAGPSLIPRAPHGLCVVESLAAGWAVEPTRDGKLVWAQLTCAAPVGPRE